MSSLEELMTKAKALRTEGHSVEQIADELSLSSDTTTWLLTQSKTNIPVPKDVHIDWTQVSSNANLLEYISSMLSDLLDSKPDLKTDVDCAVGISLSGVPLATLISTHRKLNLSVYYPSKHNYNTKNGYISGNFSKITNKNV